ncbi:MAG: hypothetical protein ACREC9_16010 [Methylocella sp.]
MGSSQAVLPFKLAARDAPLAARRGLALLGQRLRAMGVCNLINHKLPDPGGAAGYSFMRYNLASAGD